MFFLISFPIFSNTYPVIELKNITKRFPGVIALDKVTMDVRKGGS